MMIRSGMIRSVVAVSTLALTALVAAALSTPAAARGGLSGAVELEAARANARAGGPVSERDKELLERHGCLSGTNSEFCRRLEGRDRAYPKRWKKTKKRRR